MEKTHNEAYKNQDVALWKLQFHSENNSLRDMCCDTLMQVKKEYECFLKK